MCGCVCGIVWPVHKRWLWLCLWIEKTKKKKILIPLDLNSTQMVITGLCWMVQFYAVLVGWLVEIAVFGLVENGNEKKTQLKWNTYNLAKIVGLLMILLSLDLMCCNNSLDLLIPFNYLSSPLYYVFRRLLNFVFDVPFK